MRSSTSLLGRDFFGIALQARHLNDNLKENLQPESVVSVWSVDVFWSCFARNLWGKSLLKNGLWPEIIYHSAFLNIIFNYNL